MNLIRLGFEWGGNVALFGQLGGFVLIGVLAAAVVNLPWPLKAATFAASFLIAACIFWSAIGKWREHVKKQGDKTKAKHRIGIQNRKGGKSNSKRPIFGPGLDVAIENSEGSESTDEDATFL